MPMYALNVRNFAPETYSGRYNSFSCRTHMHIHTHTMAHMMKPGPFPPLHTFPSKYYRDHNGYYFFYVIRITYEELKILQKCNRNNFECEKIYKTPIAINKISTKICPVIYIYISGN